MGNAQCCCANSSTTTTTYEVKKGKRGSITDVRSSYLIMRFRRKRSQIMDSRGARSWVK